MEFFYKKHIPVLRIKVHGLMILIVRYFFSHDLSHSWAVLIGYLSKKSQLTENRQSWKSFDSLYHNRCRTVSYNKYAQC